MSFCVRIRALSLDGYASGVGGTPVLVQVLLADAEGRGFKAFFS